MDTNLFINIDGPLRLILDFVDIIDEITDNMMANFAIRCVHSSWNDYISNVKYKNLLLKLKINYCGKQMFKKYALICDNDDLNKSLNIDIGYYFEHRDEFVRNRFPNIAHIFIYLIMNDCIFYIELDLYILIDIYYIIFSVIDELITKSLRDAWLQGTINLQKKNLQEINIYNKYKKVYDFFIKYFKITIKYNDMYKFVYMMCGQYKITYNTNQIINYCIENNINILLINKKICFELSRFMSNDDKGICDIYWDDFCIDFVKYIKLLNFKFTRSYINKFKDEAFVLFCKEHVPEIFP